MLVSPPLTEASLGSEQSLAYDLFLMDLEADSVDRKGCDTEVDVSGDLVSSTYRGVRSQKIQPKQKHLHIPH